MKTPRKIIGLDVYLLAHPKEFTIETLPSHFFVFFVYFWTIFTLYEMIMKLANNITRLFDNFINLIKYNFRENGNLFKNGTCCEGIKIDTYLIRIIGYLPGMWL
jgi:hypothetical protein